MRFDIKHIFARFAGTMLFLWWTGAFVATHLPFADDTRGIPYVDKLTHVFLYAGLAFLFANWRATKGEGRKQQAAKIVIILLVYTAIDEVLQGFVGRTPDLQDAAANFVGIVLGLAIFTRVKQNNL